MRDVFDAQHREMLELTAAILAIVNDCPSRSSDQLNRLRLALSKTVTGHSKQESALLRAAGDAVPADIARRYHDELLKWRHELIACNSDWPPDRVWNDPRGFKEAFKPIVDALRARLSWEQGVVYPVILPLAA